MHTIDILALGPHPDDVEVWCGELLYQEIQWWKSVVIADMTLSQYSSRGTPAQRVEESQTAARILWVPERINLQLHDLWLQDDEWHRLTLARLIRQYRPRTILLPDPDDRHPDHRILRDIVRWAFFVAGLASIEIDDLAPYRPQTMLLYPIRSTTTPDILIPISEQAFAKKMEAVHAYHSQYDTNNHCFEYLQARAITHGFQIQKKYAIWLRVMDSILSVSSLSDVWSGLR